MIEKDGRIESKNTIPEAIKWLKIIVLALITAIALKSLVFEQVYVEGESMKNTLATGQSLVVYKFGYLLGTPERGDIVVINEEIDYIKRVIGLPGETVTIKNGHVYINEKVLDEPYIVDETADRPEMSVRVPRDCFFVMGDNRENSYDSRDFGTVSMERIKGKAVLRVLPLNMFGILD